MGRGEGGVSERERARRFGRCEVCGRVRDMRSLTRFYDGRPYPYLEVYCAYCRFGELVTALDLDGWEDAA
jgi:hypothetical protein